MSPLVRSCLYSVTPQKNIFFKCKFDFQLGKCTFPSTYVSKNKINPIKGCFQKHYCSPRHTPFEVEKFSVVELISGLDFT